MKTIIEKQILPTVHLSEIQKVVMSKILAAPTDQVAIEEITDNINMITAKKTLAKLGLLDATDVSLKVTETGMKVMKDENLVDDSGQLNNVGKQYASVKNNDDLKKIGDTRDAPQPNSATNQTEMPVESIELIRSLDRKLIEDKIMKLIEIQTTT